MLSTGVLVATFFCWTIGHGLCSRRVLLKPENEEQNDGPWRINLMHPFAAVATGRQKRSGIYNTPRKSDAPSRMRYLEVQQPAGRSPDGRQQATLKKRVDEKPSENTRKYSYYHPFLGEWRFRAARAQQEAANDEPAYLWPPAANAETEPLQDGGEIESIGGDTQMSSSISKDAGGEDTAVAKQSEGFAEDSPLWSGISKDSGEERPESEEFASETGSNTEGSQVWRSMSKDTSARQRSEEEYVPLAKSDDVGGASLELSGISKDSSELRRPQFEELPVTKSDGVGDDSPTTISNSMDTSDRQRSEFEELALRKSDDSGEEPQMESRISKDTRDEQHQELEEFALGKGEDISGDYQTSRSISKDSSYGLNPEQEDLSFAQSEEIGGYPQNISRYSKDIGEDQHLQAEDLTYIKEDSIGDSASALQRASRTDTIAAEDDVSEQGLGLDREIDMQQPFIRSLRSVKHPRLRETGQFLHLGRERKRHGSEMKNLKKKRFLPRKRKIKINNTQLNNKNQNYEKKSNKQRSSH